MEGFFRLSGDAWSVLAAIYPFFAARDRVEHFFCLLVSPATAQNELRWHLCPVWSNNNTLRATRRFTVVCGVNTNKHAMSGTVDRSNM